MSDTDFWLNRAGLREQAGAFTQYADQAASARVWLEGHTITDNGSFDAYMRVAGAAIEIRSSLIDWFNHLEKVLDGTASEFVAVADEGEGIDLEQAALIDATDPDVYNDNAQSPSGRPELAPRYERTDESLPVWGPPAGGAAYFCDLRSYDELNQLSTNLVPGDLLSPSEWIDTVLGWLGAQTLPQRVLETYGGRWGDIQQFVDTINCNGVLLSAEQIAGAIYGLYDAVLVAAAGAAFGTGTGTVWTGGGGIIGYGTAGVSLLWAFKKLADVNDILQDLSTLHGILEALGNLSGDLSNFAATMPVPTMEQTS